MASNHVAFVTAGGLTNATVAHSLYGYCTTGASTVAKTVTMYKTGSTAGASWAAGDLVHGLTITVRFQYSNTAANPTLNVNSTGAKPIYKYGTTVPGTTVDTSWPAQAVVQLTYDTLLNTSGCWVMNDHIDNTDTTYESKTAASGGTAISLVTTGEKYIWNNKSNTDTKNTAGSTDSSSKLFLIGATSQAANPRTYSQDTAYIGTDGHLYSNSIQVVNLSGSQALTNKTYNGYTLAAACAKGVDTSISSTSSTNLPTTAAVTSYTDNVIVISENEPTSALTKIWIKI